MTALSGMSSHVTSEVRKSWSASCFFPKCSWQYFNVKKNLFSGILTSDLFEMLVELFGMPPFLWFSFQFPFFIVHFHGSITRPIILSLFICSFLLPPRTEEKKNIGDSHLIYGRLSTLLIRMLFSKSTCQWHTIKTAFLIRIFMQWRYFSLMEIYKCELTFWVREKRSAWGVSFRLIVSLLKIFYHWLGERSMLLDIMEKQLKFKIHRFLTHS